MQIHSLSDYRRRAGRLLSELDHSNRKISEERSALRSVKRELRDALTGQDILQKVAQTVQQTAHQRIASVVTKCLRSVFLEDAYEFRIDFERKRGRTEARLLFVRDGVELDPTTAAGGGVVDVASFALRVACLILSRPTLRRLIVLDEPFKMISGEYRPRVCTMLETLARDLDIQFIQVTHSPELQTGTVIEVD